MKQSRLALTKLKDKYYKRNTVAVLGMGFTLVAGLIIGFGGYARNKYLGYGIFLCATLIFFVLRFFKQKYEKLYRQVHYVITDSGANSKSFIERKYKSTSNASKEYTR